jgi:phospholipid/cholesterol/gamma-HCH transport system ATP-binding protein
MNGVAPTPVLEISGALPDPSASHLPPVPLDLRVMAGDCVLIEARSPLQTQEFADLCCGLVPLRSGSVRFLGHDWGAATDELAAALRGHIGRLYGADSWIRFLATDTNILLPSLHHSRRPEHGLRETATSLSISFGLPGLPVMPADALSAADLVRASCVRAFLGEPQLLVFDNPELERIAELVPALLNALMSAHDNRTAGIWFTRGDALWNDSSFPASMRLRLTERGLISMRISA